MMERVWMKKKGTSGDPIRFPLVDGKLSLRNIAEYWDLHPTRISIGPDVICIDAEGRSVETISEIRELARETASGDGMSKESPFVVDGAPAPAPASAQEDDGTSKIGHVIKLLKKLVTGQSRLEKGLHASLRFTFWGDIASTVTSETTVQFRKSLVDYYGDEMDKNNVIDEKLPLRCMVTNLRLPGTWITAAHLLGRKHSTKAHVFGFHDIDDPRNGFLWNRAFEEAHSCYRIVFSWDRDANSFCIHVLDKALVGQKISGIKLRKPFNRSLDSFTDAETIQEFDNMTFGDLQGKLVSFNNLNRPFKRVLCLHAKLGIQKAKEEGNLPAGLDLGQYNFDHWTESSDSILLQTFLEDSQPWIKESDLEGLSTSGSADT